MKRRESAAFREVRDMGIALRGLTVAREYGRRCGGVAWLRIEGLPWVWLAKRVP